MINIKLHLYLYGKALYAVVPDKIGKKSFMEEFQNEK
jgi:hypothetical protein